MRYILILGLLFVYMIYVGFKTVLALNIISQLKKKTVMENFDDGGCQKNYYRTLKIY